MATPFDAGTSALLAIEDHLPVPRNLAERNTVFRSLNIIRALILGYETPEPAAVTELMQSETD
jgi:hypothetical protein